MYNLVLNEADNQYELGELIKMFLKPSEYSISVINGPARDKNEIKRELYRDLSASTGLKPDWGILTGVRPVKLTGELVTKLEAHGRSGSQAKEILMREYLLSEEKAELLLDIYEYQRRAAPSASDGQVGVYIGIPFCPTRCLYCSFTSNQASTIRRLDYMNALYKEIAFAGSEMKRAQMRPETLYIGGGTPTTLDADELERLFAMIQSHFDLSDLKEFTVEAGRADTITAEKLRVIKSAGANRISINPQSMREKTLELIGRAHSPCDVVSAFDAARKSEIGNINMDIIAGLPEETTADFTYTVRKLVEFEPENITVHTLAVKRASKLSDLSPAYHYEQGETVREMLDISTSVLRAAGYVPYYLYRQKHMVGNFENIGWCKKGTEGLYNIRIMEETQTIISFGAGGITKVYYPAENRLTRVPNVKNYEIYISEIDEMLKRKKENLFSGREKNVDKRA